MISNAQETYIYDGIYVIPRNQRFRIVYIPTGDKASEVVPYGLNGRFPVWIEQPFNRFGHELGEML